MRSKYILFALALTGALASCSDDDNNKKPVYNNPYSNPLTNYSAADPTVWKENDHSFYVYATNTSVIRKSTDLIHWTDGGKMFEKKPSFVTESGAAVWAPDIEKIGDKYMLTEQEYIPTLQLQRKKEYRLRVLLLKHLTYISVVIITICLHL